MALFDDDGGVIVRPIILNCTLHPELNAARATLACMGGHTIADIIASRSRDRHGQSLAAGAAPVTVLIDGALYPASTHLADFYALLWACRCKEHPDHLALLARYDAYADQPRGQRRHVARRSDFYPPIGLERLSDAATLAAIAGGYVLPPLFADLLARVAAPPPLQPIYTLGTIRSSSAILDHYLEQLGAIVIDVRPSARSRIPEWDGDALIQRLGAQYQYWPDGAPLPDDGPMRLSNPAVLVADVRQILETQPIILLCGCEDWHTCHRTLLAQYLAQWLNARVEHLPAHPTGV